MEHKIHPWVIVTRSITERLVITFNYDTNDVLEVQTYNLKPPDITKVTNLSQHL